MGGSSSTEAERAEECERPSASALNGDWEPSKAPAYRAQIKEQIRQKVLGKSGSKCEPQNLGI